MPPIRRLDDELVNKIAAGEVVERPASVVKELVENSLDAGSRHVAVTIREGGKKLIRISDDGCGIPPDELELAVARHATSKIEKFDDLFKLGTKGFRGEALASIAGVAQLSLASRAEGFEAAELVVHGGRIVDRRASPQPRGTCVTVKYLFYQTPARLKFLRSDETETAHVVDVMTKMALSRPDVSFRLDDDGKTLLDAPPAADVRDRVIGVLGKDLQPWLYPFSGAAGGMTVSGFFGHPQVARSQRNFAHFFVNGRAVSDKVLWHAVLESYRDLLMKGKYPVLVLHLEVDPAVVDVNVHPAKSEVRFHRSQEVHAFVREVLRAHLGRSPWQEAATGNPPPRNSVGAFSFSGDAANAPASGQTHFAAPRSGTATGGGIRDSLAAWGERFYSEAPSGSASVREPEIPAPGRAANNGQKVIQFGRTPYAAMRPIGQLLGTYILCEADGKLSLIDQHAAHERVGFEKLLKAFESGTIPSEGLLIPETFDLRPSDAAILKNCLEELARFGFEVEFFGGNTFVVKAVPLLLKGRVKTADLIQDLLADVRETGEAASLKDRVHHVLATMACHAQIRANHRLAPDEMSALLRELEEYQFTDFCPHGRPVSVEVTREEIEKWFRRIP